MLSKYLVDAIDDFPSLVDAMCYLSIVDDFPSLVDAMCYLSIVDDSRLLSF